MVGFLFHKTGFTLLELSNSEIRLSCYCIKAVLIYTSHKYLYLEILSCIGSEAGEVSIFHRQENWSWQRWGLQLKKWQSCKLNEWITEWMTTKARSPSDRSRLSRESTRNLAPLMFLAPKWWYCFSLRKQVFRNLSSESSKVLSSRTAERTPPVTENGSV